MDQDREDYADRDLPPPSGVGGCLIVLAAVLLTFVGGAMVTVLVVRSIPPKVAHPTEAYEGFGDYMDAVFRLVLGLIMSLAAAVAAGFIAASRVATSAARQRRKPPAR